MRYNIKVTGIVIYLLILEFSPVTKPRTHSVRRVKRKK